MTQLVKHYWVDRDNPGVFVVSPEQYSRPKFGVVPFTAEGLVGVYRLIDQNGIEFFLSTCPDETTINEVEGLSILTQQQWDDEILSYDTRQELKRRNVIRKYRDQLLNKTDWLVIRSIETSVELDLQFKNWRQSLRDLPAAQPFPGEIPSDPGNNVVNEEINLQYLYEVKYIHMINDPLPSLPNLGDGPIDNPA